MTFDDFKLKTGSEQAECGFIAGQRGCGKTQLAYRLLVPPSATGGIALIDPKRGCAAYPAKIYNDPEKILKDKPNRFIYQPDKLRLRDIAAYNVVYDYVYERGNFALYTDELIGVLAKQDWPVSMQACYQMGRERNITCLATSQRPAWIPLFTLTESSKFFVFRLVMSEDYRRMSEFCGEVGRSPDKHSFLFCDLDTDVRQRCRLTNIGGK